jgi:hypothetical protein
MISSFDVYLVMQLDDIRFAAFLLALAVFILGGVFLASSLDCDDRPGFWGPAMILAALSLWTIDAFTPSSKTAAAMILVPAMTSDQVTEPLTAEAKELYALAKQALVNVAQKPADPPKPEVEK